MDRGDDDGSHCCLVAIGRLQVTSTPNSTDLMGNNSEFISRHSVDGKFTFVDQRYSTKSKYCKYSKIGVPKITTINVLKQTSIFFQCSNASKWCRAA